MEKVSDRYKSLVDTIALSITPSCCCRSSVKIVSWIRHIIIILLLLLILVLAWDISTASKKVLALAPFNLFFNSLQILHFLWDHNAIRILLIYVALPLYWSFQSIHVTLLLSRYLMSRAYSTPISTYGWKLNFMISRVVEVSQVTSIFLRGSNHWRFILSNGSSSIWNIRICIISIDLILHSWHFKLFSVNTRLHSLNGGESALSQGIL